MPLLTTRAGASSRAYGFTSAVAEELGGMVLLKPTSIAYSGTSASIGANGSVEFSACTTLAFNGVFSASYDNYMISIRHQCTSGSNNATFNSRLRASGVNAEDFDYTHQFIFASGTTVTGTRVTQNSWPWVRSSATQRSGTTIYVYGPYLAQPTASRTVSAFGLSNATIQDYACTHPLTTLYDGFTLTSSSDDFSGLVSVYGLKGA